MASRNNEVAQECAAQLLAQGLWPVTGKTGIAVRCGVSGVAIYQWRKKPEFQERIEAKRQEARDNVDKLFLSQRENRLALYDAQARSLLALKEARAKTYETDKDVVGGDTGVVVKKRTVKRVTKRQTGEEESLITVEINYDRAVDSELRELAKQAAIERGEWSEKREVTGAGGSPLIPIVEVMIDRGAENE